MDKPVNTVSDSTSLKSLQGMIATSEDVMTMRLIEGTFAADFRMPTVPLRAGSMRSCSKLSVYNHPNQRLSLPAKAVILGIPIDCTKRILFNICLDILGS